MSQKSIKETRTGVHAERADASIISDFNRILARVCSEVERHRKPLGWMLSGLLFTLFVCTRSGWPLHDPVHEAIEALGLLLISVCIAGRVVCTFYIGRRKNHEVVRLGPYSVVRNPLYIFSVLGVTGVGFSAGTIGLGVLFGVAAFLLYSTVIFAEERRLLHLFGEDYRAYLLEVPRWLPDFRRWHDSEWAVVHSALVWRTLREGLGLLVLVPLIEVVEQVRLGVFPVMLVLK